jgi:hypothetical protein
MSYSPPSFEEMMEQERREEERDRRRRNLLDDVPAQFKRKRQEEEEQYELDTEDPMYPLPEEALRKRIRTSGIVNYAYTAVLDQELWGTEERPNEWLGREEVERVSRLLDVPLSSARLHRVPRKRLQDPGPEKKRPRWTIMLTQDQVTVAQETPDQVEERPRRKIPHLWRGVTLFPRRPSCRPKRHQRRASFQSGSSGEGLCLQGWHHL